METIELGVEVGDFYDIDELKEELRAKGYDADYENLMSSSTGFWAKMTVSYKDDVVYLYISGNTTGHFIEHVER